MEARIDLGASALPRISFRLVRYFLNNQFELESDPLRKNSAALIQLAKPIPFTQSSENAASAINDNRFLAQTVYLFMACVQLLRRLIFSPQISQIKSHADFRRSLKRRASLSSSWVGSALISVDSIREIGGKCFQLSFNFLSRRF
jgi:hypothetical protein